MSEEGLLMCWRRGCQHVGGGAGSLRPGVLYASMKKATWK